MTPVKPQDYGLSGNTPTIKKSNKWQLLWIYFTEMGSVFFYLAAGMACVPYKAYTIMGICLVGIICSMATLLRIEELIGDKKRSPDEKKI